MRSNHPAFDAMNCLSRRTANNVDQGYHSTMRAYDQSLKKLKLDYVDAYLYIGPLRVKKKKPGKH